ncbi:GGDEF domain-containing protein [Nitrogeniibacter mangrovi]|uniref:diguanylate cyclase n=1 Tax=Nitrogeniibacter mangrovi TaxID=2016596 RepID=A0A6C1B5D9_9RHOO|nr:GGDEF domain-containing protein [Nitrogeniibacter mangrovi]QID18922.1 GGDEF domain-containing protein [Nitrogeniibacter mangrovi]
MIHVLKHVESITRHRDRTLLEVGVASALYEILRPEAVNLFKVQDAGHRTLLHRLAHAGSDGVRYCDTDFDTADEILALDSREDFRACVAEERIVADASAGNGRITYCLPVAYDGKVSGVIELRASAALDNERLDLALGFINLYRNYLSLLDYSERDTLTGLLNRRTFDDNLDKILGAITASRVDEALLPGADRRQHGPVSAPHWLAVMDADRFKRINDEFGHLYGDEVLILLANLMRESFRFEDKLFRFGGEEFVAVLTPTSAEDVARVLERFREKVEQYHFPQVGQVTISIGYVPLRAGDTPSAALGAADEALYYAKNHGRNRVCAYPALVEAGEILPRTFNDDLELF